MAHNPQNEETIVLTPVATKTDILDRIPLSERRRWQAVAGIAAVVATLMAGLVAYLWVINGQWEQRVDRLTVDSYDLGERLSAEQSQVVSLQGDLDLLNEQLTTAQERISELADEKAQLSDSQAAIQQEIELLEELAGLGGSVAFALNRCISAQDQLVEYLENSEAYDAGELAAYQDDVNTICTAAKNANDIFQEALTE